MPAAVAPKTTREPAQRVAVRLDAETLVRINAILPGLSTEWREAKRADALRKLILSGLAAEEARQRSTPPPPPSRRVQKPRS